MLGRLQLWRLLGEMAVLAALSLAPQAASAHAGHSNAHHGAAAAAQPAPAVQDAATQAAQKFMAQELTEAAPAVPCVDHRYSDHGCCSTGPCTGCHGFLIVPVPATAPPTLSSIVHPDDPPPHLGALSTRLRRPPKSFG